ncbi:hypothetical protein [Subtercola frigoramans]|uniref:Uncharacterized protein n=1 Tax=Subtercola frigoramans TaxID=120298 RepID=A0ABS2L6I3_9MICO|nr:hypothetical protein [Subtercola frigoramans]MBM7472672.1 hypothetical protein [Subtercola frigoramans]
MTTQLTRLSQVNIPLSGDIRISVISDHEWQVCDRRIPTSNAESVLGYIELTNGYYDVLKLSAPRSMLRFTEFSRAVDCFSETLR